MEDLLKQIVKNTAHKTSFQIKVSNNSSIKMRELGHFLIFQFHASRHSVNVNHFNNSSVRVIYEHLIYYAVVLHYLI